MKRLTTLAIIAMFAIAIAVNIAVAQAVTAPPSAPNISPIISSIFEAIASVAAGVAVWAGIWLKAWLASKTSLANSDLANSIQQRYNEAVLRSIDYAKKYASTHVTDAAGKLVANNAFITIATKYLAEYWPDLTKNIDFQSMGEHIVARLPSPPMPPAANLQIAPKAP